jgi:tetratricopeptide (TPR) repeat protein
MFILSIRLAGLIVMFFFATDFARAMGPPTKLGTVSFPTSGKGKAQEHFLRGVAALHSFWYSEALSAFKQSNEDDPDFVMGYWGQAMSFNHPLWEEQAFESAKKALAKIPTYSKITPREKDYINAVQLLYGTGKKKFRDRAYSQAMKKIYKAYPNDLEAACFYSLSLLGLAKNIENKLPLRVKSGAIALEVFQRSPDNPCAPHYAIHAFDTPDLARLALPSANRFAKIAPDSAHAQHMPAHIFVQLGMWKKATRSNKTGWRTSVDWVKRKNLPKSQRDYHSLQWLHYTNLQQGLLSDAAMVFAVQQEDMRMGIISKLNLRAGKYYPRMFAATIIEAELWQDAERQEPPKGWNPKSYSRAEYNFVRGFAYAMLGKYEEANKYILKLQSIREKGFYENYFKRPESLQVWELEIRVAMKLHQKDYDFAIQLAKKATLIEAKLPAPSGPPRIIKPTYELLGEVYLQAKKLVKAQEQFAISLIRHPNRLRSLVGAARTARMSGDKRVAREIYERILDQLKNADPGFSEFQEAKEYLKNFK